MANCQSQWQTSVLCRAESKYRFFFLSFRKRFFMCRPGISLTFLMRASTVKTSSWSCTWYDMLKLFRYFSRPFLSTNSFLQEAGLSLLTDFFCVWTGVLDCDDDLLCGSFWEFNIFISEKSIEARLTLTNAYLKHSYSIYSYFILLKLYARV